MFSPDDITDDLDDLIEFAYLLGTLGAKILSIDDDEIVTYEILKQIKSELEEDTKEADNHEV